MKNRKDISTIIDLVRELKRYRIVGQIDWGFVNFINDILKNDATKEIIVVALLTSYTFNQHQNICLDLNLIATEEQFINFFDNIERLIPEEQQKVVLVLKKLFIEPHKLHEQLINPQNSSIVHVKNSNEENIKLYPLIFDGKNKVYLQRYYSYEQALAHDIAKRVRNNYHNNIVPLLKNNDNININNLLQDIYRIGKRFMPSNEINYQLLGIINAYINNFSIITGGPGTGKTTVITMILALLLENNLDLKINIVAPSGKAQARVSESIRDELQFLNCSNEIIEKLQNIETSTIHRLLGTVYNRPYFKHNRRNKLQADVIIIDELSMVSSMLMAKLITAVNDGTKIVLLGDRDQLSSVEAGALMANLCDVFSINKFSNEYFKFLASGIKELSENKELFLTKYNNKKKLLCNNIAIKLQHSYRFSPDKGIGIVTKKINEASHNFHEQEFNEILHTMHYDDTKRFHAVEVNYLTKNNDGGVEKYLRKFIKDLTFENEQTNKKIKFSDYLQCTNVKDAYRLLERFKILVAENNSRYGVHNINKLVEEILGLPVSKSLYHGRVIIVTENDYNLNLFNGDIGLFWRDPETNRIGVYFPDSNSVDDFIVINPGRLPQHETVFAMSVHRSQGSGFEKILFLLLNKPNLKMINRELVYTAITRAKKEVHLLYHNATLKNSLYRQTDRSTGLGEHLQIMLEGISE